CDDFSRRIARNTSSLLLQEAHLGQVDDPAGGSHLVEQLTEEMAEAAWTQLGTIETAEGICAVLDDGSLERDIDRVAAERERPIATRERPLTGLTEFPNLPETLPERRARPAAGERVRSYGAAFEALRDEPATRPVFLATMGTVAAHTARAGFATNLLAAGGIDVVNNGAHEGIEEVLADYTDQPAVCLAGTDAAYDEWGTALAAALRAAGA